MSRDRLPRGLVGAHEVGMKSEERQHAETAQAEYDTVHDD